MTIEPRDGKRTWRSNAFSICVSIWKREKSGVVSI